MLFTMARLAVSLAAEQRFRIRLTRLGAELLEAGWLGIHVPHRVRCTAGHECVVVPHSVQRGKGICRTCSGRVPGHAEARFRLRMAKLGATILGPWINTQTPILVRCAAGHETSPRPTDVLHRDRGICRKCAGGDPATAEARFRARIAELGGTVLGPYADNKTPVLVRCVAGHESRPWPNSVTNGQGICRTCANQDPRVTEVVFRDRVAELGGTILGPYVNNNTPVLVRCPEGHLCSPWPMSIRAGRGICRACVGRDPGTAEAAFRARIAELGGVVVGGYAGKGNPVACLCPEGHECAPRPNDIQQGIGMCGRCAGKTWDAFYVVTSRLAVKFGITSGDPRPRLAVHARDGYRQVVKVATNLPPTVAAATERAIISALALAREQPLRGREYFDISCLALILDVADSWLKDIQAAA